MADEVTPPEPAGDRWARWRRPLRAIGWGALAVMVVAAVLAGVHIAMNNRADETSLRAKPGDCFSGESDRDLRRVPCDDPAVRWMVLGVVQRSSEHAAKQQACAAWPNAEASYWESRNGTDGFVLCLGSVIAG
ncbi:hypothetical protein HC028_10180 [Planosporangium flavigriseum]|uniref:Uncharacterized protein n=1 Tax=Planosporangium flavigriseum TaxID=373681 RepID=A0A8J3PL14_9ACTN|nr:hypothetical protein [Planosporangium flavigriseum]NJC64867.1 hypothetical protein [Planosporangium flavigriseum]GIG72739.1 hypothetical protein Pfl04_11430 [Planosporangium flavigriseum]